jgi:hypothetical protein
VVVYYSKSGNTKALADAISKDLRVEALPVNLMEKKGQGTKEERQREKTLYAEALAAAGRADLVVVGTPTGFQKAKSMIVRFVRDVEASNVGLFCTYYDKVGTTLTDLEDILRGHGIRVVSTHAFAGLNPGQFAELDPETREGYLRDARDFVEACKRSVT